MGNFEKEKLKKERKMVNNSWFDCQFSIFPTLENKKFVSDFKDITLNFYN